MGVYEHELLGTLAIETSGDHLRTLVGPQQFEARLEHKSGDDFTMSWENHETPAKQMSSVVQFDAEGAQPQSLTIEGFVFARKM